MTLDTLPPYSGMSVELSTPEQRAEIYGKLYDLDCIWIPTGRDSEMEDASRFGFYKCYNGPFICSYWGGTKIHHIPYEQWLEMLK